MKKLTAVLLVVVVLLCIFAVPVQAVKPANNLAGAQKVVWNLSGAVMPSPPWGLHDIPSSDTASKLIVNQPNGMTEVTLTGAMNGLAPNTVYTVYISNGWAKNWNIVGPWTLSFVATSGAIGTYNHHMDIATEDPSTGAVTGTGYYIPAPTYTWVIDPGSYVLGNKVHIQLHFTGGHPATWKSTFDATIDPSTGSMAGTWIDTGIPISSGTITSLAGHATGGYSGLLNPSSVPPFTFTTDAYGAGSWHVNLVDADFPGAGTYTLSVWINDNSIPATVLISNNFPVTVD